MVDSKLTGATSSATKDMSIKHPKDGEGLTDKQKVFVNAIVIDIRRAFVRFSY